MSNDKPKEFKYSIWETRTADVQPNIKLKDVKAKPLDKQTRE
jgi:hypothetical protein